MRTNDERYRFLRDKRISITWNDDKPSLFWRGKASPGEPGKFFPLGDAPTLDEATDRAIERWEKKHQVRFE